MNPQLAKKFFTGMQVQMKAVEGADGTTSGLLMGYASTYDVDQVGDRIMPGAWGKSIREAIPAGRVKLVDSHNMYAGSQAIIGKVTTGVEDSKGLLIEAVFASTTPAQQVRTLVQEGILSDFSVGFRILADGINPIEKTREIKEAALVEVSVVASPCNLEARILRVKNARGSGLYFKVASPDTEWKAEEAEARWKAWVSPEPLNMWGYKEWGMYSSGYLHATPEQRSFLLVDIVGGEPCYIVEAAKAASTGIAENGPWAEYRKAYQESLAQIFKEANVEPPTLTLPDTADVAAVVKALRDSMSNVELHTALMRMERR